MYENINQKLKEYIENKIFPEYELNDKGHNLRHINIVLERAYEISKNYQIDKDMLYCIVSYHDIACHINREIHEKLSAQRLFEDVKLREFFNDEQINLMKEAIEDHRASLEYIPRSIYGKILSSADRKFKVDDYFTSSLGYSLKKKPNASDDELIEDSFKHAIAKFGKNGYATKKFYVKDDKYEKFLKELQELIEDKESFDKMARQKLKELK